MGRLNLVWQSVKLIQDVLPIDEPLQAVTIRNHVLTLAERLEDALGDEHISFIEGCPRDWGAYPSLMGRSPSGLMGAMSKPRVANKGGSR